MADEMIVWGQFRGTLEVSTFDFVMPGTLSELILNAELPPKEGR